MVVVGSGDGVVGVVGFVGCVVVVGVGVGGLCVVVEVCFCRYWC